ncbi:MAG: ATP-binding protein, partial [Parachlamydiaceae bacterium]
VVLLSGARQCGKSTLAQNLPLEGLEYRTLDNATLRSYALDDPDGFIQHKNQTLVIDEVQRAPDLLTAIKAKVDQDKTVGQFLLTGSSNLLAIPTISESLAGRIQRIRLRGLTQSEISGTRSNFIEAAFAKNVPPTLYYDREQILEMALRGGFPEAIALDPLERPFWHKDYIEALLERDLRDILNISKHNIMEELLQIMAAWSSKFMDISAIGSHLAISRPTLQSYMNALEALYLLETVPPWIKTDYDRIGKHNKVFMADCGMMSSLLDWNLDQIRLDGDRCGKLVETFIFNELSAQIDYHRGLFKLFHYRDHQKREIDFIIEKKDGSLLCLEVKAGMTVGSSDFKHIIWFKENIAKMRPCHGIILYAGERQIAFGPDLLAIPISALWSS